MPSSQRSGAALKVPAAFRLREGGQATVLDPQSRCGQTPSLAGNDFPAEASTTFSVLRLNLLFDRAILPAGRT